MNTTFTTEKISADSICSSVPFTQLKPQMAIMDDSDEEFECLTYPPPNYFMSSALPKQYENNSDVSALRRRPMTGEDFRRMFDKDGRLLNEHAFRQAVFKGGMQSIIRKEAWKFLFGYYPCHSTKREREVLRCEKNTKYAHLKKRWKTELDRHVQQCSNGASDLENSFPSLPHENEQLPSTVAEKQQHDFHSIQAQVYAGRLSLNVPSLLDSIRSIDKDVPRTDRSHLYYKDESKLSMLRNVLVTFSAYHEDVGYAQGMNDIASRFLIVMESESDAYWCFSNFVENIQVDFLEVGMAKKLELLRTLLNEIDDDLFRYLTDCQVQDLAFCHRWLLLCFLREFEFDEGLRMFEIVSSHYLEMNSLEAQKTREISRQKNSEREGSRISVFEVDADSQLTFVLFVCVAILLENRGELFSCSDTVSVFQCVNSMTQKMSVDEIVAKAEKLFYAYCHKSVIESFQVIEEDYPDCDKSNPPRWRNNNNSSRNAKKL